MLTNEAKESVLEIQVDAALAGHDLGPFEPLSVFTGGYEARVSQVQPIGVGRGFGADV